MDTVHEEITTHDPVAGVTQTVQSTEKVANRAEVVEAQSNKKTQVIWYIVGIINTLLILRVIFLLLGARTVGFATALYSITHPFVAPFTGIFASPAASGAYFDSAAIVAIVVYTLVGWGLSALIDVLFRPSPAGE